MIMVAMRPEARKGKTFDHFLVGHDLIRTGDEHAIDTLDPYGMLKNDRFAPRTGDHKAAVIWCMSDCAPLMPE